MPAAPLDVAFLAIGGTPRLTGQLYRPEGDGPFPAVVLLHGCEGIASLYAVDDVYLSTLDDDRFRVAVAFYPRCLTGLQRLNAPLMILIGDDDDWTPAGRCRRMEVESGRPHELLLKIYPGAHHGFDRLQPSPRLYLGHRLERNPEAAADAEVQVQRFLARFLKSR